MHRCVQLTRRRLLASPLAASRRGVVDRQRSLHASPPSRDAEKRAAATKLTQHTPKEEEEAPRWLRRMAPTKGGTALPSPKEAAVIAVVAAAGFYAWFIDPPKEKAAGTVGAGEE